MLGESTARSLCLCQSRAESGAGAWRSVNDDDDNNDENSKDREGNSYINSKLQQPQIQNAGVEVEEEKKCVGACGRNIFDQRKSLGVVTIMGRSAFSRAAQNVILLTW